MRGVSVVDGPRPVVEDLELAVEPGDVVGLETRTAAGTSLLLAVLAGRERARSGQVLVDGEEVDEPPRPWRVGYVSPNHELVTTLTATENLVATLLLDRQAPRQVVWSRAEQQLADVGLPSASWHNLVEQLSGGQQQRVALARVMVAEPSVMVLDNPTSELDPDSAQLVAGLLARTARAGTALVLASTDAELLAVCTQRVRLTAPGSASEGSMSVSSATRPEPG